MAETPEDNNKEIEALKVELLGTDQKVMKLTKRLESIKEENDFLHNKLGQCQAKADKETSNYEDVIAMMRDDYSKLLNQKLTLDQNLKQKTRELAECQEASKTTIKRLTSEWETKEHFMQEKYKSLEERYNLIVHFEKEKAGLNQRIQNLEETLEKEIQEKWRALADLQRDKLETVERMKKEADQRVEETKNSLLAFKTEQLDMAAKIAVNDNHKLRKELTFQNKEVEELVALLRKNEQENSKMTTELAIFKEMENEMAKKLNRSKGVVKKLSDRIKELEGHVGEIEGGSPNIKSPGRIITTTDAKKKDEVIKVLEVNLKEAEKRLAKLQNDYGILLKDFEKIEDKLAEEKHRYIDAAYLVKEQLHDILEGENLNQEIKENASSMALSLDDIKGKNVDELEKEQRTMLLNLILQQIKSHLNEKNLMNALYPVMKGRSQSYGVLIMEKKAYQLPNIHEKSLNNKINKMKFSYNPLNLSSPLSPNIKSPKGNLKEWSLPTEPSPSVRSTVRYKF